MGSALHGALDPEADRRRLRPRDPQRSVRHDRGHVAFVKPATVIRRRSGPRSHGTGSGHDLDDDGSETGRTGKVGHGFGLAQQARDDEQDDDHRRCAITPAPHTRR